MQHVFTRSFIVKPLVGNASDSLVIATFLLAKTHKLAHLSPEPNRLVDECSLVRINRGSFPNEIGFVLANKLGSLEDLPENEEAWVYHEDDVVLDKRGRVERVFESTVAVAEHHDDVPAQANPGAVRLEIAVVWLHVRSAYCQVTFVVK